MDEMMKQDEDKTVAANITHTFSSSSIASKSQYITVLTDHSNGMANCTHVGNQVA